MTIARIISTYVITSLLLYAGLANPEEQQLGDVSFPNSGASEAQSAFLRGVGALHSFEFGPARIAFEEAQAIDPSFALAYWGQAMSDNHQLWEEQDRVAAVAALNRLAPDFQGRLRKAPTEKEKAYMTAIETLYFSPGDKLQRDFAYSEHMARMHERWRDDHEIAVFYAWSLLGTVRRGDQGFRRQALAASICQDIFAQNENHPGAAHCIIHSFDDPDHAILALGAANVYARIAPAAGHALHMPSHIFVQLGMWQRVVDSNIESYNVLVDINEKYNLPEGHEDFHALAWLAYGNLMLGHYDRAKGNLTNALAAVGRNPGDERVFRGSLLIRARHMIETGQWEDIALDAPDTVGGSTAHWVAAVGMSAAHRSDTKTAKAAIERLESLRRKAAADGRNYDATQIGILAKEVTAITHLASGDTQRAIDAAREAAETEVREMSAPSGPPLPMKPAAELYGDVLMAAGRPAEALLAYERSIEWIPYRTPSMLGLAKAASAAGDKETADETLAALREMPGINRAIK